MLANEVIKKNLVPGLKVGKTGLEKAFENDLLGTNGIQRYEVNAYGKRINQLDYQKSPKGKTIKLTTWLQSRYKLRKVISQIRLDL